MLRQVTLWTPNNTQRIASTYFAPTIYPCQLLKMHAESLKPKMTKETCIRPLGKSKLSRNTVYEILHKTLTHILEIFVKLATKDPDEGGYWQQKTLTNRAGSGTKLRDLPLRIGSCIVITLFNFSPICVDYVRKPN